MIGSSENRISYNGNGIATEFAYTFKILEKSDMKVLHVAADGTETLLVSDYYVDMEKNVVLYPGYAPGAEIPEQNRPPILPVGERLVLYREVPITQESALDKHWPFNVIENGLDKLTIICQQIWDRLQRSFYVSESTSTNFDPKVPIEAGKTFRVKDDGTGFEVTEDPGKVIDGATALLKQTTEQAESANEAATNAQNAANTAEKIATDLGLVDEAVQTAVSSAEQASNSATTASNKADVATTQADVATTKASEASTSADTATQKADAASTSAISAAKSYANADAVATQLTEYLATKESLTAPAVDKTLLIEGAAADSKVVGELKSDLYDINNAINIKLPHDQNDGYFIDSAGGWNQNDSFTHSNPIPVDPSVFTKVRIVMENYNQYVSAVAFSESADTSRPTIISSIPMQIDVLEYEVDIPNNAKYMFIAINGINSGKAVNYCKYARFYMNDLIETVHILKPSSVKTETIENGAVTYNKQSFVSMETGNNIYDQSSMIKATGKWYEKLGNIVEIRENEYTGGYACIDIPVDSSKSSLTISAVNKAEHSILHNYFFTDDDSNYIFDASLSTNFKSQITIQIPSGASHLKLNVNAYWYVLLDDNIMVNYGSSALDYEKYHINPVINGLTVPSIESVNSIIEEEVNSRLAYTILKLPRKFDLIVGDTFELFYKGICNVLNTDEYDFEVTFSDGVDRGKGWKKKYEFTPIASDIGTKTLNIIVRDNVGKVIDNGSVNLVINNVPSSPSSEKVILCVGDSLTTGGVWCSELRRRLIATDGSPIGYGLNNIKFIGAKTNADGCKYEGYGGWKFSSYLSPMKSDEFMNIMGTFDKVDADQHSIYRDSNGTQWKLETIESNKIKIIRTSGSTQLPTSGILTWVSGGTQHSDIVYTSSEQANGNPFWNESKNKNDFTSYASKMGVSKIDHCIILLGWNDTGTSETNYKNLAKQFIDGLREEYPNCKITLLGVQVPSRDGFANNYGVGWKYYDKLQFVWNLNQWYQDISDEYENIESINISGQFDTEHNMPAMSINVNIRSSEQVTVQSNGVHPATSGYLQIADAVLRNICSRL